MQNLKKNSLHKDIQRTHTDVHATQIMYIGHPNLHGSSVAVIFLQRAVTVKHHHPMMQRWSPALYFVLVCKRELGLHESL